MIKCNNIIRPLVLRPVFLSLVSCLFVSCTLFLVPHASAAELFFGANNNTVSPGSKMEIAFFVSTDGKNINAVQSKIVYDKNYLRLADIKDGGSLLTLWVEKPRETTAGEIIFSGIVPGGFAGESGYLLSLIFETVKTGATRVKTLDSLVLLNDGKGTADKLKDNPIDLVIQETGLKTEFTPITDSSPPEDFIPQIIKDQNIYNGLWTLVFNTEDKESGIDHYEVQETYSGSPRSFGWTEGRSPYLLRDQKLISNIFVKAVDKAGLEIIEKTPARFAAPFYKKNALWIIIALILAILASVILLFKRNKR